MKAKRSARSRVTGNVEDTRIKGDTKRRRPEMASIGAATAIIAPDSQIDFSLIVPVYKNLATLSELIERIERLAQRFETLEAVFVVDGSPDECHGFLRDALPSASFQSQLLALSRNFGAFAAVRTGLNAARGDFFAVMSADLQEPEELIVGFFDALKNEPYDVVMGSRRHRNDPPVSRALSKFFWATYRRFVQPEVPEGGVDMFACNRSVRDALLRLEESRSTLVGLLYWLGFRRKHLAYDRLPRASGRSGWTWRRRFEYLMDSCFAFSNLPIRALIYLGAIGLFVSILVSTLVLGAWLTGNIAVPGYVPIMLAIGFSMAVNIFGIGIVGAYTWRTFENTKRRPDHVLMMSDAFAGTRKKRAAASSDASIDP